MLVIAVVRSMVATKEEVSVETVKAVEAPVAVVTGASRGIGKAIALALGAAGCKVIYIMQLLLLWEPVSCKAIMYV
jgi:hypothetical protein